MDVYKLTKQFTDTSYKQYGSFAHAAGFMESMLAAAISQLPSKAQKQFMEAIEDRITAMKLSMEAESGSSR